MPERVIFFGWGKAAEYALRAVAEELPDAKVLVISGVDQAGDAPLNEVCAEFPERLSCCLTDDDAEVEEAARSFAPDLILSSSYRKKIKAEVLGLCPDALNFHPSLLPKHKGCFSGFWSIFEGDTETGVTCHRMVEKFDEGRLIHAARMPLDGTETSVSIYKALLPVTETCMRQVLELIKAGALPEGEAQEPGSGSYHFRNLPFKGIVQPEWPEERAERFIRAMHFPPFEGACIMVRGEKRPCETLQAYREAMRDLNA